MAVDRYDVVDPATKTIVGGPYQWDGVTEWTPPQIEASPDAGYLVILESDAVAQGYVPAGPPVTTWVLVDDATMTVIGGPWSWNGEDRPAPAYPEDGQQLLTEADAQAQGYTTP